MVSAGWSLQQWQRRQKHTELFLDDLEDLLVIKLAGYALHRSQGLASITLCSNPG